MLEVELLGAAATPGAPTPEQARRLCADAAAELGIADGHVAIELVDERRMTELNAEHRGRREPTDVLSFPIDGVERLGGERAAIVLPRELGDIVICPQHTADLNEAIVHGMLHLLGMDHETDDGEMLALQRRLLARGRA